MGPYCNTLLFYLKMNYFYANTIFIRYQDIMRNQISKFSILLLIVIFSSCSGDKLDIKGEPEAIDKAALMIKSLGGKSIWGKLRSVYIRTVKLESTGGVSVFEEWINLDEPRFMNRVVINDVQSIKIIDGNDGWALVNGQLGMLRSSEITSYLNWHENFIMRNFKRLAEGGEEIEVRLKGPNRIDMYVSGKLTSGFNLDTDGLPISYISDNSGKIETYEILKWGEYKGYKYPLEIKVKDRLSIFKTDYWDPSVLDAESAFRVTFNPNELSKMLQ